LQIGEAINVKLKSFLLCCVWIISIPCLCQDAEVPSAPLTPLPPIAPVSSSDFGQPTTAQPSPQLVPDSGSGSVQPVQQTEPTLPQNAAKPAANSDLRKDPEAQLGNSPDSSSPASPTYVNPGLSPGDSISIRMFDFTDVGALETHVNSDGSIHLPYAGTLQASGLTPEQLQEEITKALQTRGIVKEPNVTVDIVSSTSYFVSVVGQVVAPKPVPLIGPAPLSWVLAQVGGTSGLASPHITILHRGEQLPTSVDYDPEQNTSMAMTTQVFPGDVVNVSARGVFFAAGEVGRPGIYPIGGEFTFGQVSLASGMGVVKNLTLLEALAQAGGVTAIAARSKMHILRTVDGKRVDILVDQVKLSKGQIADPLMRPNDIIYIPPSYLRQQTNNLFATALSGLYAATSIKSSGFY